MNLPTTNPFQFYQGNDLTFTLPSGHTVTIREQNGDDDETLSLINPEEREKMLKNMNIFLTKIIKDNTMSGGKYLDMDGVSKLLLRDKYYILLKSRLQSIGSDLKFTANCPKKTCKKEINFKEDLNRYDTDLSKFKEGNERYKYQITPYPLGKATQNEVVLSSGKKVRYSLMTVGAEDKTSELKVMSDNTEVYARNLELYNPESGEWQMLGALNVFGKREMIEIKADMDKNDAQFMMIVELECPHCGHKWEFPFIYLKDFFFPAEI